MITVTYIEKPLRRFERGLESMGEWFFCWRREMDRDRKEEIDNFGDAFWTLEDLTFSVPNEKAIDVWFEQEEQTLVLSFEEWSLCCRSLTENSFYDLWRFFEDGGICLKGIGGDHDLWKYANVDTDAIRSCVRVI